MPEHITNDKVLLGRTTDPAHPIELRFGPRPDSDEAGTEGGWTVERLSREQAWRLVADLQTELVRTLPDPFLRVSNSGG